MVGETEIEKGSDCSWEEVCALYGVSTPFTGTVYSTEAKPTSVTQDEEYENLLNRAFNIMEKKGIVSVSNV